MDSLISVNQLNSLLQKTTAYSQRELMQLASFSCLSLADKLSDLSSSEKSIVAQIEGKNLYYYLNACRVAIGDDKKALALLNSSSKYSSLINEIESVVKSESSNSIEKDEMYCMLMVKMILSRGDSNFKVKIDGQVPTKLFSFRETNANDWFNTVTSCYSRIVGHVLAVNNINDAQKVLFLQCAWHMHHSQPNKYSIDEIDINKILNLAQKFISDYGN